MMKPIYLIGTGHPYQTQGCKPKDAEAFLCFLSQKCHQYSIKTVAEELNEQALEMTKKSLEETKERLESKNPKGRALEDLKWIKKALERWEGKSVAQKVATELSLKEPLFCDPDSKQRELLGIEDTGILEIERQLNRISSDEAKRRTDESWSKRERYWLEQLQKKVAESDYPVLFICGARHVQIFSKLLEENDFNVSCICDDWEPSMTTL